MNATEKNHARENAAAHLENLRALFAAIDTLNEGEAESVTVDGETFTDVDTIDERVREIPLSVQVRSDWQDPGESLNASEFELLLTTGGPALRVCGDLDEYRQPARAYIQYQDWGTPWMDYFESGCGDLLLRFAAHFFYGE